MEGVREGRHLAAIMFVDMVGYSARMQENEARAIAAVRGLWELVRPILAEHSGREVDLAGDGMLMEFPGALAAVRCAIRIQHVLHDRNQALPAEDRIRTRAGVHLGDIEHKDGRIYGDGVNIAARIIGLSPPGGVALSAHVKDQLLNVLDQPPQRLGSKTLKNIKAPIEIWCIPGPDCTAAELAAAKAAAQDEAADRRWIFGQAIFDERTLELSVTGTPVELEKKALDVLSFLLHHAGEVVTKDEILEAVWPGRVVTETVLTKCISKIREVIKDEDQSGIKTVHGFGYRLTIPVKVEAIATTALPHFDFKEGDHPHLRPLWSLIRSLGQGGHGEVWLARHDKTKEERVYKFALDPAHLASLKREITLSRVLNDTYGARQCFVRVLDWNLEQLPYFIECEYSQGGSLVDWADAQGGLEKVLLETRLEIAAQTAEALAAAHSVGVLHKDLKPSNVLIDLNEGKPPKIKLADFGSGGVLDPNRLAEMGITRMGFTKTVLNVSDSTSGTPVYLAPEILAGQPWTSQADIYALGVVLYQLAVGDLQKTLAPGWEKDIPDELLREDISTSAAGNPSLRLADASLLAQRLRTLDERRARREAAKDARLKAEKQQRAIERYKVRRWWTAGVTAVLVIGAMALFFLYVNTANQLGLALVTLSTAADKLEERGELAEAEALLRETLYGQEFSSVVDPVIIEIRNQLAMLLMKQNRLAEAEEEFTRLLSDFADLNVLSEIGTDMDYFHARFSSNYGECLRRAKKYEQAQKVLESAQTTMIKTRGADDPRLRENTERLRQVYRALGLKDEEARLPPPLPHGTDSPRLR
jgi:class 3 adenylate cyclase/serine/threonine protein kinase